MIKEKIRNGKEEKEKKEKEARKIMETDFF